MKKLVLILIAVIGITDIYAQPYKFWVQFTDKNGSPYSISNPSVYLSARALARRAKYGIPIKMNDLPPNPSYIDSVLAKGVKLLNRSRWFNAISVITTDSTKMAAVRALPFVKSGNFAYGPAVMIHKTNGNSNKWSTLRPHTDNPASSDTLNFGYAYLQEHMIGVDCLNNKGYRGKGMQIAVIDTRFGRTDTLSAFDSLRNRSQILGSWDFVWEDPKVYDTANSDTHGQMVLGCMAGNIPGQYLGDAVDADYYLLRTEDVSTENIIEDDNWTSAAEYADSAGADVITSSLGYSTFDYGVMNYDYADMNGRFAVASEAATIAVEKGLVVCVAAGNEGSGPWHYITSPGDADSILTVGAVDGSGNYASFSSTGPTSDGRVKPDVVAMGLSDALCNPGGGVTYGSGTSFATPITAGAVASLWQANPTASNYQVMQAVKQSASQYTHPDSLKGYGIPNFCVANAILTGIAEHSNVAILDKVFPNPFNNSITVEFYSSLRQHVTITLYNSIGQAVHAQTQEVAADGNTLMYISGLSNLPPGLYLVTLGDETGKVYTGKVIKQ